MSEDGTIDLITGWPAEHAVVFRDGRVTDLGTLPGGYESQAISINDRGQVSGFGSNGTDDPYSLFGWGTEARSFVWENGVMQDIGTLGGADAVMGGMNARGQIFGVSYTNTTPNGTTGIPTVHPFIWEKGRIRDLGSLGGTYTEANSMNNDGQVAGISTLAGDTNVHPFLWDGRRMIDLGTLNGGDLGVAKSVNDEGHVTPATRSFRTGRTTHSCGRTGTCATFHRRRARPVPPASRSTTGMTWSAPPRTARATTSPRSSGTKACRTT